MKRLHQFNLKLILSLLIAALSFTSVFSNKLVVSVISANQSTGDVTFDISWQNSWNNLGTTSANWDAAWVFIKWRNCTASANTQFTHGLISTSLGDHNFNVNMNSTALQPTLADGSAVGIDASPNNTGVMLRCANQPFGTAPVSNRVTVKTTNLPTTGALDVRVYGIEMVFVPSGSYYLGDGNGSSRSYQSFASSAGGSSALQIASESAQNVYESTNLLGTTQSLSAAFPKGYGAFYIMKYEITQGQYVDFLNGSKALVQSMHWTSSNTGNRYTITPLNSTTSNSPGVYTCTRPYRACNFLSWADVASYLDWAALRPLTELEYEKACRGSVLPNNVTPTPYENAMAVTFSKKAVTISGSENGQEYITVPGDANVAANISSVYTGGDAGQGPLRGGIFATANTAARSQTGASYYGVMELSGNVDEYYISSISGVNGGVSSSGVVQGDGILDDASAQFNQFGWPVPLFPGNMIIHRGGNWNTTNLSGGASAGSNLYLNVSDRQGGLSILRANTSGGRGGRSVTPTTPTVSNPVSLTYTGYMQYFVVPAGVTSLTIAANGAGGAGAVGKAGLGSYVQGVCAVTPGEVLKVLVGGTGTTNGGGGGTYIVRQPYNTLASVLVVAGGGGGQSSAGTTAQSNTNGQITSITTTGPGSGYYNGGGSSGSGGYATCSYTGAGGSGAGFLSNGTSGCYSPGTSFVNGGGTGAANSGYGGGGLATGTNGGGGGGGYGGGEGSYNNAAAQYGGGGGGSINRGTSQVNYGGGSTNTGPNSLTGLSYYNTPISTNGQVQFSW